MNNFCVFSRFFLTLFSHGVVFEYIYARLQKMQTKKQILLYTQTLFSHSFTFSKMNRNFDIFSVENFDIEVQLLEMQKDKIMLENENARLRAVNETSKIEMAKIRKLEEKLEKLDSEKAKVDSELVNLKRKREEEHSFVVKKVMTLRANYVQQMLHVDEKVALSYLEAEKLEKQEKLVNACREAYFASVIVSRREKLANLFDRLNATHMDVIRKSRLAIIANLVKSVLELKEMHKEKSEFLRIVADKMFENIEIAFESSEKSKEMTRFFFPFFQFNTSVFTLQKSVEEGLKVFLEQNL